MTLPRRAAAGAVLLLATTLAGCSAPTVQPAASAPAAAGTRTTTAIRTVGNDDQVDHVLAISIDGLNPDAIRTLGAGGTPTLHAWIRTGAATLNARTEYELTRTLPNHTGMLTGRRIDKSQSGHGVTFNSDTGTTVHAAAGHYVSSVFDVVHDHGGSTALFAAKEKFALYARTWNTAGAPDRVGEDNGPAKIDRVVLDTDNTRLVASLTAELTSRPRTFTFLHLSLPDEAGHAYGWSSPEYLDAVRRTDALLASVQRTVLSQAYLRRHLLVVLTADHGGGPGAMHSDPAAVADYRVPFLAWGAGVPAGRDLYRTNPTFQDPGTGRPTYSGKQPIRNGDVANLVTDVLDLPVVSGSSLNRPRTLDVFAR